MSSSFSMTGDNMKSQLFCPELLKFEVRKSIQRRKMNKSSPIVNGDHLVNVTKLDSPNLVSLSIEDHIVSCPKSSDISKSMDNQSDRMTLPCETDHIYANSCDFKSSKEDSEQVKHLKEMLLVHLDLIQQQQEQLLAKERQLQTLKLEKEALKCRLERMERRMSLLRQKNDNNRLEEQFIFKTEKQEPLIPSDEDKCNQPIVDKPFKRKALNQSPFSNKKIIDEKPVQLCFGSPKGFNRQKSHTKEIDDHRKNNCLSIDQAYTCHVPALTARSDSPIPKEIVEDNFDGLSQVTDESLLLTVPSWRYHPVSSCYQLEGTENLDDEVYLKRHQKLELDERRRKRWDIQRIRDQRLQEKFKQGRKGGRSLQDYEVTSFFPNPEAGEPFNKSEYIEITDTVPVVAFGHTIPILQHCEFKLPWLEEEDSLPLPVVVKPEKEKPKGTYAKKSKTK